MAENGRYFSEDIRLYVWSRNVIRYLRRNNLGLIQLSIDAIQRSEIEKDAAR